MRSRLRHRQEEPLRVVIASNNPETLDGLQEYFQRAGVAAHATRHLRETDLDDTAISAVVLFPDDYPPAELEAAMGRLSRMRPTVRIVLVTREPRRFEPSMDARSLPVAPVILPKPAWGWTILDNIRTRNEE